MNSATRWARRFFGAPADGISACCLHRPDTRLADRRGDRRTPQPGRHCAGL